jgi:hypothetical protein
MFSWKLLELKKSSSFLVGTCKIGELRQHNGLGFFCCWRSLKIHIEIERELFMYLSGTQ